MVSAPGVTTNLTGDPEIDGPQTEQTGVTTVPADDLRLAAPEGETQPAAPAEPNAPATEPQAPPTDASALEPPAPQPLDLSTPEGIKRAEAESEAFAAYLKQQRADAENAGRQRRESELRRDQGSAQRAQVVQQSLAAKYGITLDEEDARALPLYVKLNEDSNRAELYHGLIEQSVALVGEADGQAFRALADSLEGHPDELQKVTQIALDAIQKRSFADGRAGALAEFDPDKIAPGTPEFGKLIAWHEKRVAAEQAAQALEARTREQTNAPRTPIGATVGETPSGSEQDVMTMTTDDLRVAYGNGRIAHQIYKGEMARRGEILRA